MQNLREHAEKYRSVLESRVRPLPDEAFRTPYERDAHRILYSDAFRRLRHKAQVFFIPSNDHICTRIEHVLHVAAASCTVARQLGLNLDLTNAIALGHDIGHAPFGHHGETVLSEIAEQYQINGGKFQHELHGLRVVDRLARLDREPGPGLNLTYAVRDGIISHCGEDPGTSLSPADPATKILESITDKKETLHPATYEGCIVRLMDKIVYAGRDIEDALQAGLVSVDEVKDELGSVTNFLGSTNGEIINTLVSDLIRNGQEGQIALSEGIAGPLVELIRWNYKKIYFHPKVERYKPHIEQGMRHLFDQLLLDVGKTNRFTDREKMPEASVYAVFAGFVSTAGYSQETADAQIVLDFVAGMTDNYLIRSISELFLPIPIA